jgi:hypothetical protein
MFDLIDDVQWFLEEYGVALVIVAVNLVGVLMYNVGN